VKKSKINLEPINGTQIYSQLWEPEKKVVGVVVLVHGLGEHADRYGTHFAKYFNDKNYAIVTFDLPGHGKSGAKRGQIKQADDFRKLVSSSIAYAKTKYPNLPIFIYGHSLGGLISLETIIRERPEINGAIITAPVIDVNEPIPPIKLFLAKVMDKLFPSFALDSGLKRNLLSRDVNVVNAYNSDPLVHGKTSSRLGMYIINTGSFVRENAEKVSIPTFVMVGSAEGIVSKNAIDTFCKNSELCEEKEWPGLYHELHNEPEKNDVLDFAFNWMEKHS
jgi:alpha-beta hydrolase superfamily lysophospholipase